jgi:acyl-CoA reductase-like NAD-dependent aldehyde dehydrogenase
LALELGGNDAGIVLPNTAIEPVLDKLFWGYFFPLTVIADATDDMRVVREEQFGPVVPVIKYGAVEDALKRANAIDLGLGGSVWGNDREEVARIAQRLQCGTAWVNQHGTLNPFVAADDPPVRDDAEVVEERHDGSQELLDSATVGRCVDVQHAGAT